MQDTSEQDEGQASEGGLKFRSGDLTWVVVSVGVILVGRVSRFKLIQGAVGKAQWVSAWGLGRGRWADGETGRGCGGLVARRRRAEAVRGRLNSY